MFLKYCLRKYLHWIAKHKERNVAISTKIESTQSPSTFICKINILWYIFFCIWHPYSSVLWWFSSCNSSQFKLGQNFCINYGDVSWLSLCSNVNVKSTENEHPDNLEYFMSITLHHQIENLNILLIFMDN